MDNTQFQNEVTNRNKIITPEGKWTRITVPVKKNQKFHLIKDVEINNDLPWGEKNYKLISSSYQKSKFFPQYKDYFKSVFKQKWNKLFELNLETIKQTLNWLDIKTEIIIESKLNISGQSTERLVNICKAVGAEHYVSGEGGKKYLDTKQFEKNNISIEFSEYVPTPYPQLFTNKFLPNLSIIDLIMNMGNESSDIIKSNST